MSINLQSNWHLISLVPEDERNDKLFHDKRIECNGFDIFLYVYKTDLYNIKKEYKLNSEDFVPLGEYLFWNNLFDGIYDKFSDDSINKEKIKEETINKINNLPRYGFNSFSILSMFENIIIELIRH